MNMGFVPAEAVGSNKYLISKIDDRKSHIRLRD